MLLMLRAEVPSEYIPDSGHLSPQPMSAPGVLLHVLPRSSFFWRLPRDGALSFEIRCMIASDPCSQKRWKLYPDGSLNDQASPGLGPLALISLTNRSHSKNFAHPSGRERMAVSVCSMQVPAGGRYHLCEQRAPSGASASFFFKLSRDFPQTLPPGPRNPR